MSYCKNCGSKMVLVYEDYDRGYLREKLERCQTPGCDYEKEYFEGKRFERGIKN
ncbi:MAG: hypothetical protein ACQEQF_00100 [Bacillota bacterium]